MKALPCWGCTDRKSGVPLAVPLETRSAVRKNTASFLNLLNTELLTNENRICNKVHTSPHRKEQKKIDRDI
jgi:hypothetical protein